MKRILASLLTVTLALLIFCSCGEQADPGCEHTDTNNNGMCDTCGQTLQKRCTHADDDGNMLCDKCGQPYNANDLPEEPETPNSDYEVLNVVGLSLHYPVDWTVNNGSVVTIINPTGIGNNVTVAYTEKTAIYDDMTLTQFNNLLKPIMESSGITISNANVQHVTNPNSLKITKITYDAKASGVSLKQTLFITTFGTYTYTVTVTESTSEPELVSMVFNSLKSA